MSGIASAAPSSTDLIRVLHVDDEPSLGEMVATFLERENDRLDVETVMNADDGLDRLADREFDCVVSDYDMPGRNGIDFLEAIRTAHSCLPFILYTGKGSEEVASKAITAGATDYLQKGTGTDQYTILANRIVNVVERERAQATMAEVQHLFTELANRTNDLLWLVSHDWDELVFMTEAYEDIYGQPLATLQADPHAFLETTHPDDRDWVRQAMRDLSAGHSVDIEYRVNEAESYERHVWVKADPITDSDGTITHIGGFSRDITERKAHERDLERASDLLEKTERIADVGGWEIDTQTREVFWTDHLFELLEVEYDEEPPLEEALDVYHEDDRPVVESAVEAALCAGEPFDVDVRFRRPDGEIRWLRVQGVPTMKAGEVVTLRGAVRDITEQRAHERELEQARGEYAELIDGMNDTAWVIATDGTLLAVNDAAVNMLGYSREELLSMRICDIDASLDDDEIVSLIDEIPEDRIQVFETVHETRDGAQIPVEISSSLVSYRDETAILSVGRNISNRKEREKQVRRLHKATRELLTAETREEIAQVAADASNNILEYPNTVVRLVNDERTALHAVGITDAAREELGERPVYPIGEGTAGEAYERGEPLIYDDVSVRDDGYERGWGRAAMYLPIGEYGTISISDTEAGVFDQTDINLAQILAANTETALQRIERERQLGRRNEQLAEFATIVSHDIRNPLNVVQGRVELASDECDSEHLERAMDALERSFALVDDLLALAQDGRRVGDAEAVDLADAVARSWRNVATADATLVVETERTIRADRNRLQGLLENLVRNAVEHGGEDVVVTVGDLPDGFYVADDGPGLPENEHGSVFDVGFSTRQGGTGMGLNIVREIADAHGWECSATDGEAGGARFEFTGIDVDTDADDR